MKVKDVLRHKTRDLVTAESSTDIVRAMELLIDNEIGCLPVMTKSGQLVGLVSDTDIFRGIFRHQEDYKSLTVGNLMTTDVIVGLPEDEIDYIGGVMDKNGIRHVPILEKEQLVGIITISDIAKARLRRMEIENRYLKMYMNGNQQG